jgi:hypothetical protein
VADPIGLAHRLILETAAARGVDFHGGLDPVVVSSGRLPTGLTEDFEALGKQTLVQLEAEVLSLKQKNAVRALS